MFNSMVLFLSSTKSSKTKIENAGVDTRKARVRIAESSIEVPYQKVPGWVPKEYGVVAERISLIGGPKTRQVGCGNFSIANRKNRLFLAVGYESLEEALSALPSLIALEVFRFLGKEGDYRIGRTMRIDGEVKTRLLRTGFATREEAKAYVLEHAYELLVESAPVPRRRPLKMEVAPTLSSEDFLRKYGFAGIAFGSSMTEKEKLAALSNVDRASGVLAEAIGFEPTMVGLHGLLSLTIGSLPGKQTHFDPATGSINLSKNNKRCAFAHEWWHGFDFYISNLFDRKRLIRKDEILTHETIESSEAIDDLREAYQALTAAIEASSMRQTLLTASTPVSDYWASMVEMTARCFEAWLYECLKAKGIITYYLIKDDYDSAVYPKHPDLEELSPLYQALFDVFIRLANAKYLNLVS